jgi:hypothetical protein
MLRKTQTGAKWRKNGQMFYQMFYHVLPKCENGKTFGKTSKENRE